MYKSFHYRIYPTKNQIKIFERTFECCDYMTIYCLTILEAREENYDQFDMMVEFPFYKMRTKKYIEVFDDPVTYQMKRVYKMYRKLKWEKERFSILKQRCTGLHKFRVDNWFGYVAFKENYIRTAIYGDLKIKGGQPISGEVLFYVIKKTKSGKYFISVCCQNPSIKTIEMTGKCVGVDMGIKHFLTLSNGKKIDNPCFLQNSYYKLRKKQRQLSKKEKRSNNYKKKRLQLTKLEEHITNQRKDFLHKVTSEIIKEYDIICVENLNIKIMQKNKDYSKAIHDASWFTFIRMLEYKAKYYSKKVIKINSYYPSSQKCFYCGYVNKSLKNLSIREWECPMCRSVHDCDINAAKNILNEGLKKYRVSTVGATGIYACGDEESMNQEAQTKESAAQVSRET